MGTKAKESQHVMKVREKLEKKISKEQKRLNQEALDKMARLIERQLVRHAGERIDLKSKEIQLFDENRHPAAVKSKFVDHLLSQLKAQKGPKPLKGRIRAS